MSCLCLNITNNLASHSANIAINHIAYCSYHNYSYKTLSSINHIIQEFELFENIYIISNRYLFYEFNNQIIEFIRENNDLTLLSTNNTLQCVHNDCFLIKKSAWSIKFLEALQYHSNIISLIGTYIDLTKVNNLQNIGYFNQNTCIDISLLLNNPNMFKKPYMIYNSIFDISNFDRLAVDINKKLGIYNVS